MRNLRLSLLWIVSTTVLSGCPAELRELCARTPVEGWGRGPAALGERALEDTEHWKEFAEDRLKRTQSFLRPARMLQNATEVRSLLHTQANAWVAFLSQVDRGKFQEAQETLAQAHAREGRLATLLCPKP